MYVGVSALRARDLWRGQIPPRKRETCPIWQVLRSKCETKVSQIRQVSGFTAQKIHEASFNASLIAELGELLDKGPLPILFFSFRRTGW